MPFSFVMAAALYDPEHGFYATGGAGRGGADFLTSPEVGPLFGAVVARALDEWWDDAGRPDPFTVVEAGAGRGALAISVLAAGPACAPALRYVLVERSAPLRARQAEHLALETPALAFAPALADDDDDEDRRRRDLPTGPIVVSLAELPRLDGPAVVLANELLDNLPFDVAEHQDGCWWEIRVGLGAGELTEVVVPLDRPRTELLRRLAPSAPDSGRVPLQDAAATWVREARRLGRVVVFDYAATTADLAGRPWLEWLRTYRGHQRGDPPLAALGEQDITAEVAIDQLPSAASHVSQREWLERHGIDDLVAEGRRVWDERRAIGDLAALRARSRINESEALLDPTGLGAFRVLEWREGKTR